MWDDAIGRLIKQAYSYRLSNPFISFKDLRVVLFDKESHILVMKELTHKLEAYPIEKYLSIMANEK